MLFLKRNYLRLIGAKCETPGSSRTGETPQAFTPRRLTARTKESEHLEEINHNSTWKIATNL
ncbi:hypothetical protein KEH51_03895 [[Brevibacterium] frigoritolerans]|uniref:Uncharacterized protein n=1 Tax=Peribacillus frigoritolerans TaxID=450367 RepID=A0A941FIP2_9BACI|nr:hypothetical protein [Peribacillus frigoritolerans]